MKTPGRSGNSLNPHPLYCTWQGMIQRCTNPKHKTWKHYGGRGIQVCEKWRRSFEAFVEDMPGWSPGLTLHRKNDGNYEPGECCWATMKEQNNHSRHNRLVTLNGETLNVTQWCDKLSIPRMRVFNRIHRGWSEEEALSTPARVFK